MFKALLASLLLIMIKMCSVQGTPEHLNTQLGHEQADTAQINSFYQMGIFYLSHYDKKPHLDSAEVYLNRALVMARAAHRSIEINNCNWQLSNLYLARNNLPVAERYCTLLANAHEAKHETARQAETWLRFGENVLNKLTDTGKKSPESAADLAEIYFNRGIRVLESLRDTGALIEKEIHAATFYHIRGYDQRYRRNALEILKRFEKSRFRQLNVLFTDLSQVYRNEGNNNMSLFYLQKNFSAPLVTE